MLERYMPGTTISPILKDASDFKKLQDVGLEVSFYFGHVIPSFCSKFDNLDLKIFPPYIFGMQPFIERQLYKVGIINYSQDDRYDKIQSLCLGTVFFPGTWSTGFLDIYFNLGIICSALFFILITFILFMCNKNLKRYRTKYKILTAFNILFIITMFMAPVFFDTMVFFSYVLILVSYFPQAATPAVTEDCILIA